MGIVLGFTHPLDYAIFLLFAGIPYVFIFLQWQQISVLQKAVFFDTRTGIFNQSAFLDTYQREIARAKRYNYPLSLVSVRMITPQSTGIVSFDPSSGFARIGSALQKLVRTSDSVAVWDPRTYSILLPHTGHDQARIVAEKIETRLRELRDQSVLGSDLQWQTVIGGTLDEILAAPPSVN